MHYIASIIKQMATSTTKLRSTVTCDNDNVLNALQIFNRFIKIFTKQMFTTKKIVETLTTKNWRVGACILRMQPRVSNRKTCEHSALK